MTSQIVKVSKFLSLVLRHRPESIGLELDKNGWADIETLIEKSGNIGREMTRQLIDEVVENNDKKRFSISDDGLKIRANQGHSISVDVEMVKSVPPDDLYHGTVESFYDSIQKQGLKKQNRLYVHLSSDVETAIKVGGRRGKPIVLKIDAGKMHQDSFEFYLSANGVWQVDHVPPEFISVIDPKSYSKQGTKE